MSRFFAVFGLFVLVLAALAATVGYLAYGPEPTREGTLEIAGLSEPVGVGWMGGHPIIEAQSAEGVAAALGYVHGVDDAWSVALWRQAALGDLGAWFGEDHVSYDRHARTLGFGAVARQTYTALSDSQRVVLNAYARGLNRAFAQKAVAQSNEFVLLDVEAEPFAPWHALAIERLVAWLGTTPPADSLSGLPAELGAFLPAELGAFLDADALYRSFLLLGGAEHARAWAAPLDSTGFAFIQQHTYGASALPLIREVTLRRGGRSTIAATVPGTLIMPGGLGDGDAWSVFLTSPLDAQPTDAELPPPAYDRLVDRAGNETLLTVYRASDGLYFAADAPTPLPDSLRADTLATPATPTPTAPSTWALRWPGFAPGTDLGAWLALTEGREAPFRLFRGDGLRQSGGDPGSGPGQALVVLGNPPVRVALPGGVFVAADTLARYAAEYLGAVLSAPDSPGRAPTPADLATSTNSAWATEKLPGLLAALGNRDSLDADLKDPYAFLLSWDARYSPDAIGASLFETWLAAHHSAIGAYPTAADSVNRPILQQTLRLAVAILKTRRGARPSAWRWEYVQPGARFFPVWTVGDETEGPAAERYAPLRPALGGHPTAPLYGPSLLHDGPAGVWTAWSSGIGNALTVRSPVIETDAFLARERAARELATPYTLARDAVPEAMLTLEPPRE